MTLKWQNLNATIGHKINCNFVKGSYFTDPECDSVRWNEVSFAQLEDFNQNEFDEIDLSAFNIVDSVLFKWAGRLIHSNM